MSIKEFAEKYMKAQEEAWQNGNFDALEALEDPNVVYHIGEMDIVGFEAHKQDIMARQQAIPDRHQEAKYLTGESNIFVLSLKEQGKIIKEMPGLPYPVGKDITVDAILVARLDKEKIIEAWIKGSRTLT
jgi:predicted ester cyclase